MHALVCQLLYARTHSRSHSCTLSLSLLAGLVNGCGPAEAAVRCQLSVCRLQLKRVPQVQPQRNHVEPWDCILHQEPRCRWWCYLCRVMALSPAGVCFTVLCTACYRVCVCVQHCLLCEQVTLLLSVSRTSEHQILLISFLSFSFHFFSMCCFLFS